MNQNSQRHFPLSRRDWLRSAGLGFGMAPLADLLARDSGHIAQKGHFAAKAKAVIYLFMHGGPSQVDTFDPKPALARYHGQRPPASNIRTERGTGPEPRS